MYPAPPCDCTGTATDAFVTRVLALKGDSGSAVGKVAVRLDYQAGGHTDTLSGRTSPRVSDATVNVFVRSAMNLPLVGQYDDLANARVEVSLEGAGAHDAASAGERESKDGGGGDGQVVFTNVVNEERNPRWDRLVRMPIPPDAKGDDITAASGTLVVRVVDVGQEARDGEPARPGSTILSARLPLKYFPYSHCHNLRLHWPEHETTALFVTIRVTPSKEDDVRQVAAAPDMQRLQLMVHGFASPIPAVWLDLLPDHDPDDLTRDGEVAIGQLRDAELVVSGTLLASEGTSDVVKLMSDAEMMGSRNAEALASARRPTTGGSRASRGSRGSGIVFGGSKRAKSFRIGEDGAAGREGKLGDDLDEGGIDMATLQTLPLTTCDVAADGRVDEEMLAENLGDFATMRTLTQISGPAVPPAIRPQWGAAMEFTVGGGPNRHRGVAAYPDSLTEAPCGVLLTVFRRDVPPVSPVKGPGTRRHSLNATPSALPPLPAPSLRVARALVKIPDDMPMDGTPVEVESLKVEDLARVTVIKEEHEGTGTDSASTSRRASLQGAGGAATGPTLKVSLRAWGDRALERCRAESRAVEDNAAKDVADAAAEAERLARSRAGSSGSAGPAERMPTPTLAAPPSSWGARAESKDGGLERSSARRGSDGEGDEESKAAGGAGQATKSPRPGTGKSRPSSSGSAKGASVKTPRSAGASSHPSRRGDAAGGELGADAGSVGSRDSGRPPVPGPPLTARDNEDAADEALRVHWESFSRGPSRGSQKSGAETDAFRSPRSTGSARRRLEAELEELRAQNEALRAQVEELQGRKQVADAGVEEVRQERDALEAERDALKAAEEQLRVEVDRRSEAIRSCGVEIVRLRKHAKALTAANARLVQAAEVERAAREREDKEVSDDALGNAMRNVDLSNPEACLRRMELLAKKYISERRRTLEVQAELEKFKDEHASSEELQAQYSRLLAAHTKQNRFIHDMQDDLKQTTMLKETIKTQEKVIAKLEEVLESRLAERGNRSPRAARGKWREARDASDGSSTARSSSTKASSTKEEADPDKDYDNGPQEEGWIDPLWGGGDLMEAVTKRAWALVNSRLVARETRLEVLEEELKGNAADFGNTMADLKMKILNLEMGDLGGDDEDFGDMSSFDGSSLHSGSEF